MAFAAGEQLREARELKGLTVEDVAARLKVPARYIRALEEGDVAALPEPTFVRGYVKAYARALGLDADALLGQLAPVELKAPRPLVAVDGGTTVRKANAVRAPNFRAGASRRRFGVMIAVALVLVVVVFAFVALRERHQQAPVVDAMVATPSMPTAAPAVQLPAPASATAPPAAPVTPVPVAAAPAGQAVTMEIHLPLPPAPAAPVGAPASPAAAPAAPGQAAALPPAGSTSAVPGAKAATAPGPASPAAPATPDANVPPHGLYIRFRGPSWVEVRDANNRILHTGTPSGGTDLSIDGKAPLSVTFSDSSVADVWYNGVHQQDRSSGHARVNRIIVGQAAR